MFGLEFGANEFSLGSAPVICAYQQVAKYLRIVQSKAGNKCGFRVRNNLFLGRNVSGQNSYWF